jgi:hypothetical protein
MGGPGGVTLSLGKIAVVSIIDGWEGVPATAVRGMTLQSIDIGLIDLVNRIVDKSVGTFSMHVVAGNVCDSTSFFLQSRRLSLRCQETCNIGTDWPSGFLTRWTPYGWVLVLLDCWLPILYVLHHARQGPVPP